MDLRKTVLRLRIRTFLVGSGYGRPGPDPDPGLNKSPNFNYFGVCKSCKYFRNLCSLSFWIMSFLFRPYFRQKNFK
jgi:hypothetical protein